MRIYVRNESTSMSDADVLDMLPALRRQTYHVREWWRTSIEDLIFGAPPVDDAWQLVFAETSDEADALGYHDYTPGGRPIAYVFVGDDLKYGYSPSVTASHEICEMIVDPWIAMLFDAGGDVEYAAELCDPVEDDALGYQIHVHGHSPVLVSDFVLPNWFQPDAPLTGKFSYRDNARKPFDVLPGGYAYVKDQGEWYGEKHDGTRLPAAELPERRRLQKYARDRTAKS
jgi:hypothetical protein